MDANFHLTQNLGEVDKQLKRKKLRDPQVNNNVQ